MRFYFITIAILLLIGAGCATTQRAEPPADIETTNDGTTTVTTDDGASIEFQTGSSTTTQDINQTATTTDDYEVPVIDVILGGQANVEVNMEVNNYSFSPSTITAKPGDKIKITFSKSTGFHTFTIDALELNHSIAQGESLIITAPSQPGQYPYYCDIGSNRELGMKGTLIVQ